MLLLDIPNEILLRIAWFVPKCHTCHCRHKTNDLFALSRCSRQLHSLLTPELACTSTAMHMLLWAIWHNRPDTAAQAITHGADINFYISERYHVGGNSAAVSLGTPLDIAIRNRLRPMDTAGSQLAFEICTLLLNAGGTLRIHALGSIVKAGDTNLLQICLPHIININARTNPYGKTLLALATTADHGAVVALLSAAGPSMEGTGRHRPTLERAGAQVQVPMDESGDFRVRYPGWNPSWMGSWDEWGPVCMLPGHSPGCMCPWCPLEVTGGYSVLELV